MKNIEILFMGCGRAADLHSRVLAKHFPEVGRSYLSGTSDQAEAMARRYGGRVDKQGMAAAFADKAVDAVFVTTPPATHVELTLKALDAGKHVVVEKPAFLDVGEFDSVEAAARRAGKQVLVAENYFYKPLRRTLSRIVEGGLLGQIRLIEINAVKRQAVDGWRLDPALSGGGALFEGGVHWVSLMANLGLDIESCRGFFPDAPPGHERSAVFVAEYGQGAVGVLNYSWEIPSKLRGLRLSRIWGTRGSILFESNGLFAIRTGGFPRISLPVSGDMRGYRAMLADFMRVLRTGALPEFTLRAARRDVELVQEAYSSASTSRSAIGRLP